MQSDLDLYEEAARETARQVHDLEAVTAAQAMPALCFLLGAYAPRRLGGRGRDETVAGASGAGAPVLRSELKIVKARVVTAKRSR
jgi:hypothetical protein